MTEVGSLRLEHTVALDIDAEEQARLVSLHGRTFIEGETLIAEGAPANAVFLLHEGRVRVFRRAGGSSERTLAVLHVGDLLGEEALGGAATYSSGAIALTGGSALSLDREALGGLVERHPLLGMRLLERLARRLLDAEELIEMMMMRGIQTKVTSALLKLAYATGSAEVAVSPAELAARVGLDADSVKRTVFRLRDRQYLIIRGESIEIADVDALRRLLDLLIAKDEIAGREA